MFIRRFY